jgi:asparagine synthase (glutamine-hydrolysing)
MMRAFIYATTWGLAQRRLAIIDTSAAANQPMWDKSKRYTIIFNGEIFNYQELRSKYFTPEEQQQLRTSSDTEILLELFIKQGREMPSVTGRFFCFCHLRYPNKRIICCKRQVWKKTVELFYR